MKLATAADPVIKSEVVGTDHTANAVIALARFAINAQSPSDRSMALEALQAICPPGSRYGAVFDILGSALD